MGNPAAKSLSSASHLILERIHDDPRAVCLVRAGDECSDHFLLGKAFGSPRVFGKREIDTIESYFARHTALEMRGGVNASNYAWVLPEIGALSIRLSIGW